MPYDADGRWISDIEWYDREADVWRAYESQIAMDRFRTADPLPEPEPLPPVVIQWPSEDDYLKCYWCSAGYEHKDSAVRVRRYGQEGVMCSICRKYMDHTPIEETEVTP